MRLKLFIVLMLTLISVANGREIAIVSPQEYTYISAVGWNVTSPTFSPDSTLIMFDMQGNVNFPVDLLNSLDSMQAELISERNMKNWLVNNNWIEEE